MIRTVLPIYVLLLCLLAGSVSSRAQSTTDSSFHRLFTVKELREDMLVLKDSLYLIHPALSRYNSRQTLEAAFQTAYKKIDRPMPLAQFYGIMAPVIGKVGDIHTTLEFPDEYFGWLTTGTKLLPLDIRIINGKIFIAGNNSSDSTVRTGAEIIKINDQPAQKILKTMESYFSGEGHNTTLKSRRVEQRLAFLYHIAFGFSKEFKIQYTGKSGVTITKTVTALPFSDIKANRLKNKTSYPGLGSLFVQPPFLVLSLLKEKQTAVLTIKWFQNDVLQGSGEQFKPFIDSAFLEIKKAGVKNFIIDTRRNEGGESENAGYLYSYLTDRPFGFLDYMETNKIIYERDHTRGVNYSYIKETGKYRTRDSLALFISPQFFGLNKQQPQPNNFKGNVWVLADGITTSAATQFISLVKLNKRGLLIGEEVPGSLYGGSGRGYAYFLLPNTWIFVMISHYRVGMAGATNKTDQTLIIPDHKATITIEDLLNGKDTEMKLALRLAEGEK
ncbi:MAG TPA: S41 family peptidase [Chitinophagaceae bacterium]|jgi:hypothetical protein|nr:S41 family peptidase [Chitinophagaceae bacterium]